MSIILNNPKYEYYCDSVAAQYVGGNILASALQKVLDLQLANELILKDIQARNDDFTFELKNSSYLPNLDAMIKSLLDLNLKYRVNCFNQRTTSHPSPKSRIERVRKFNIVLDESKPILSNLEVEERIDDLSDSDYLTIAKEIVRQRKEEQNKRLNEELEQNFNNKLRVLHEGASNLGKADSQQSQAREQLQQIPYWLWLYFSFNGRVSRKTFQLKFLLPFFLIQLLLSKTQSILNILVYIFLLFPFFGIALKRCHDRDKSGSHFLLEVFYLGIIRLFKHYVSISLAIMDSPSMELKIISFLSDACIFALLGHIIFSMTFLKGTNGPNKYGSKSDTIQTPGLD